MRRAMALRGSSTAGQPDRGRPRLAHQRRGTDDSVPEVRQARREVEVDEYIADHEAAYGALGPVADHAECDRLCTVRLEICTRILEYPGVVMQPTTNANMKRDHRSERQHRLDTSTRM